MGLVDFVSNFDGFARLPKTMTDTTATGGFFTVFNLCMMALLISLEFKKLFVLNTSTLMQLDENSELEMEIYFNVTMLDLPCEFASLDIIDVFGTNRLDYTAGITKVRLHHEPETGDEWLRGDDHIEEVLVADQSEDFEHYVQTIQDEDLNFPEGKHAPDVNPKSFKKVLKYFQIVMVNFYAPWCIWSKKMAPGFEETAKAVDRMKWPRKDIHVKMVRVDCTDHPDLCKQYNVKGYPTVKMFKNGELLSPAYNGDRTKDAWIAHLQKYVHEFELELPNVFHDVGCEVSGSIRVNRCPGNFHLQAKSGEHSIAVAMTNVSHRVNHLSFGAPLDETIQSRIPETLKKSLHPLNGKTYVLEELHTQPQHYIKVVPSIYQVTTSMFTSEFAETYQMTSTNRIASIKENKVPEAKFKYNFSPVSIKVEHEQVSFYHFVTRFFAVLGGAYTIINISKNGFQSFIDSIVGGVKGGMLG